MPRPASPSATTRAAVLGLVAVAVVGLTGCAAVHDSTSRVTVTLSADTAPSHRYTVQVLDEQDQLVEHQQVFGGQRVDFAGVPLGKITIRARGLCSVHTTLHTDEVVRATLGTANCSA